MAGFAKQIHLHIGDAREIIPKLGGKYDLIFIDAGKQDYQTYYELILKLVQPGSFILTDNVLWDGKVILEENDDDTKAIKSFNQMILQEERLEVIMLPVRDGMSIARVK
jgi:predicted O-methyltransferase YrrM